MKKRKINKAVEEAARLASQSIASGGHAPTIKSSSGTKAENECLEILERMAGYSYRGVSLKKALTHFESLFWKRNPLPLVGYSTIESRGRGGK